MAELQKQLDTLGTIAVIGGAGFIGSHICDAVMQNSASRLVIVDDFSSGSSANISRLQNQGRISTFKIDARDLTLLVDSLVGVNTVIHLASNPDIAKAANDPLIDFQLGTLLTQNSLEAARLNNVKTFIYASGSGIYGNVPDSPVKEEFEPKHPVSCYGASKLAGEAMISAYSHMFGIQGLCFRFANVVGSRQTHGVGFDFIRKLLFDPGRLEILGNGSQTKNYVWVGDVIDAIFLVATSQQTLFDVFNVSSNGQTSVKEIAALALETMNLSVTTTELVFGDNDRGWRGDVPNIAIDSSKLRNLGWMPSLDSTSALRSAIEIMYAELLRNPD